MTVIARLFVVLFMLISLHTQAQRTKVRYASDLERKLVAIRKDLDRYAHLDENDQEAIGEMQGRILEQCQQLLNDPRSRALEARDMDLGALQCVASDDDRLWLLGLDLRTGGTFRERSAFAQIRQKEGHVGVVSMDTGEGDGHGNCDPSIAYFSPLITLDDSTCFTVASTIGCSTCIELCATTLRLRPEGLYSEVFFSYSGRMGLVNTFDLDTGSMTFSFAYEELEEDPLYPMEGLPKHSGSFQYKNGNFQLMEHCESR
jgi:hypothetical protein